MKEAELKKYTREELYKGMKIKDKKQLSNIYDTWIFLINLTHILFVLIIFTLGVNQNCRCPHVGYYGL